MPLPKNHQNINEKNSIYEYNAIKWLRKASKLNPDPNILSLLSKMLYFNNQLSEALDIGEQALLLQDELNWYIYKGDEDFHIAYSKMLQNKPEIDVKKYMKK